VKFIVPIEAVIDAESQVAAEIAADRVKNLLANPMLKMSLQSNGVKLLGAPVVGKPKVKA
jgi:hypothetical protein